ncbi:hypothetical protein [Phocoenobacter skyensis]|uniref:Uncharacterized protein n=1 Tax=Phocoenobacter skyensis TaxID=97481 RepID=A0A1H7UDX7_9PAST|nr:hypothetical protein [Pasteurella skyensis]MDP8080281.1 hypothetical protein [Pasteurella skyensis]MDP8086271.1 hypothetical protein [Pasteurella skyensis]MDP8162572.1 hypothetical protein [Pasteurella skyensis]MDP8171628.1 hypothetical protein [Pasteurella skyensis]MDP8172830.1 hypothetical protein [Pasteurella skyensis]
MNNKPKINGLIIASFIINPIIAVLGTSDPALGSFGYTLMIGLLSIWGLGIIGLIVFLSTGKKAGVIMMMISFVLFVPIGLIGIFGAKKVLEDINKKEAGIE